MSGKIIGLPWVEKYRPNKLDDLISHQEIISTIQKFIDNQQLPHLLFYGPPGTGKTSTILAVAKQLYGVKNFKKMVLELNASDDRGIGVVRSEILNFASTASLHCKGFKVIILDECDAMTRDAQAALRRVMEKYTKNVRFCLICNYLGKLIPAIQSRCTRFRFAPLSKDQMMPRINHVVEEERINIDESGMELLLKLAEGDMRRKRLYLTSFFDLGSLNILQASHLAFNKVTEEIVYKVTGRPNRNDIRKLMEWLLNQDIKYCIENIQELMVENGLALNDVLTDLYEEVCEADLPEIPKAELLSTLADIEYRLNIGASEKIQLAVIVAAFSKVRNTVPRMEE